MKKVARRVAALVASAMLVAPQAIPAQALPLYISCRPVHVVQAAGTGFSSRQDTGEPVDLHFNGYNPAKFLHRDFGDGLVATFNVNYPSSLGRFSAWQTSTRGSENLTYGESVLTGANTAVEYMQFVKDTCPDAKFILIGHSQGSSVVGDAAARVASGKVRGVKADDIAAVAMYADPGRSHTPATRTPGRTRVYAPVPRGTLAQGGEIIIDGGTGVAHDREGMTGPRPLKFHGLEGKVLSMCHVNDMACSNPKNSLVSDVAGYANRVEVENWSDDFTSKSIATLVAELGKGTPLPEAFKASGLGLQQSWTLAGTIFEIINLVEIVNNRTRPDLPVQDLIALGVMKALPNLIYSGMQTKYISMALDALQQPIVDASPEAGEWYVAANELFKLYANVEDLYYHLRIGGWAPDLVTPTQIRQGAARSLALDAVDEIARRTGLDKKMADPRNADYLASMEVAGDFGNTHVSYFDEGFEIDGKRGSDWVDEWLATVTSNVIRGRSFTY